MITVISVGKIKEKYYVNLINKFTKEINKRSKIEFIELMDEKCPENLSEKEMEQVKDREGQKILDKIPINSKVVALAIEGKQLDSETFKKNMNQWGEHVTFIIGGSLGLSKHVMNKASYKLSFSNLTFPHQLMKVILVEQILKGVS